MQRIIIIALALLLLALGALGAAAYGATTSAARPYKLLDLYATYEGIYTLVVEPCSTRSAGYSGLVFIHYSLRQPIRVATLPGAPACP